MDFGKVSSSLLFLYFTDNKELVTFLICLAVLIFILAVTFLILAYRFR